MTSGQVPEGRYGYRPRTRHHRWARWSFYGVALLVTVTVALIGYANLGSPPLKGKHAAFAVRDDQTVSVTVELQREQPQRPAVCVVRARSEAGNEVGRKEVLMPPSEGTMRKETVLRTSARAVIGEVYGCSYTVPEYLSTHTRPSG